MLIGIKYIFRENLSSSNSYAAKLLKNDKVQEGTIIYTNYQTEGRGQKGNTWESEDGKNLLISLILYPSMIKPSDQFIISKIISLGIGDFLRQHTDNVSVNWPNDIYVNNDKIAGILIEISIIRDEIENVIAGIGLNLNQKIFKSDSPNPVSLALIGDIYSFVRGKGQRLMMNISVIFTGLDSGATSAIQMDYLKEELFQLMSLAVYRLRIVAVGYMSMALKRLASCRSYIPFIKLFHLRNQRFKKPLDRTFSHHQ
jgi:BirA family biotin operon repressor/biotin-[acetyl-CoA-carboxylase] ligase